MRLGMASKDKVGFQASGQELGNGDQPKTPKLIIGMDLGHVERPDGQVTEHDEAISRRAFEQDALQLMPGRLVRAKVAILLLRHDYGQNEDVREGVVFDGQTVAGADIDHLRNYPPSDESGGSGVPPRGRNPDKQDNAPKDELLHP